MTAMARPDSRNGVSRVTDDERREVACKLRKMAIRPYIRYKDEFFDELAEVVLNSFGYHSFSDVLEKLADIIDPERGDDD